MTLKSCMIVLIFNTVTSYVQTKEYRKRFENRIKKAEMKLRL